MSHLARTDLLKWVLPFSCRIAASAALGLSLALSGSALTAADAEAQSARKGQASAKSKSDRRTNVARVAPSGPLVVNVSLRRQRLTVYDGTKQIAAAPVSSGRRGHATPMGVFSIVQKRRHHISNIYNVAMPNMQRLTWSGIALHAGALPGYPASSGCIRLPSSFSRQLFGMTKMGTRVIVTRDPVTPAAISHERLFAAYPPGDEIVADVVADAALTQVADASQAAGAASDTVSTVLGVTAAHAAETSDGALLSTPRQRFLERRAAEASERADALRTAQDAWARTRKDLEAAEHAARDARATLAELQSGSKGLGYLEEVEEAVSWARGEIERLAQPEPEVVTQGRRAARNKQKQKPMSDTERAARIAELRLEIEDAELEIAPLRERAHAMREARTAAEARAGETQAALKAAKTAAAKAKADLANVEAAENAAKKREELRALPVSVFVSRERRRLYVRQGYHDIFDVEVSFKDPDAPIGTHVFTALDYEPGKNGMVWSVVSVPQDQARTTAGKQKQAKAQAGAASVKTQTAKAALERFDIPEDAREAIADVMKPGSSMIISDFRMSNETGKYTDFIATIR